MNNYLTSAIQKLRPTAEFSYTNEDYSTIKWDVLEGDAPTQEEIDQAIEEIKAEELQKLQSRNQAKSELLERLGITEDEAKLLLP